MKLNSEFPVLIKFQSKDIIDSLQSGTVYMKELNYFRTMEKSEDSHEIGDCMENKIFSNAYESLDGKSCSLVLTAEEKSNFVFCMFYAHRVGDHFRFSDEQKEKLLEFGDTALVIWNSQEFISRVINESKKQGYDSHSKEVFYYKDDCEISMEMTNILTKGLHNFSFFKRDRYSYQQEYRIVINTKDGEKDHITLDIGDISDISYQISTKQVLEEGIDLLDS